MCPRRVVTMLAVSTVQVSFTTKHMRFSSRTQYITLKQILSFNKLFHNRLEIYSEILRVVSVSLKQ